jgi:hypothetical protein
MLSPGGQHRGLFPPSAGIAFLCCLLAPFLSGDSRAAQDGAPLTPAPTCLDSLSGPRLETTVVGFRLQVQGRFVQRTLSDFDIIIEGNERLLPLLRLLRLLKTDFTCAGSSLTFQVEGAPATVVDTQAGTVALSGVAAPTTLKVGISDVTSAAEVYLPEAVMAGILKMTLEWKEESYQYEFTSGRDLAIFNTERERARAPTTIAGMGWPEEFSGDLPAARVRRIGVPRLNFAEVRLQTSQLRTHQDAQPQPWTVLPNLRAWGEALGGSLVGSVSQRKTLAKGSELVLDQANWTTWLGASEGSLGDNTFGLSELAFPSLSLLGARVNGLAGAGLAGLERDPSMRGRRLTFLPSEEIHGYAPLGTQVTLFINGQELETRTVEPDEESPSGEGLYRFSGRDLLLNRLNEIRLVFRMPDGRTEESRREVLGVNRLVPRGGLAYLGGAGTRSMTRTLQRETDGSFMGGRIYYGLTSRMTIGGYAARQEGFVQDGFSSPADRFPSRPPPRESTHWGTHLMWMPLDRLFLDLATGQSSVAGGRSDRAFKGSADLRVGRLQLRSDGFWFGPRYEDGRDFSLGDRAGARLGLSYRSTAHQFFATGVRVGDNLDHALARTTRLDLGQVGWSLRPGIPRTTVGVKADFLHSPPLADRRLYTITVTSSLLRNWSWRSQHFFGTPAVTGSTGQTSSRDELEYRTRLLTGLSLGDVAALSTPTSEVQLERSFDSRWSLSLDYRHSSSYRRALLELARYHWDGLSLQLRAGAGYDWLRSSPLVQERLELALDRGRRNMLMLEHHRTRDEWSVRLLVQLSQVLGFAGHRPYRVTDSRFDPNTGGVLGRVYLDKNGNGIADRGEPGLPDVQVITDTGWRAVSGLDGRFLVPADSERRRVRVGLKLSDLSAEYSAVVPAQEAQLRPGMVTHVDLAVATLGSISGRILSASADGRTVGVPGIQVLLLDERDHVIAQSTTAGDGSYYLGDVRGGVYRVSVDSRTIPPSLRLESAEVRVEVKTQERAADVEGVDFLGTAQAAPEGSGPPGVKPPPKPKETRVKVFGK